MRPQVGVTLMAVTLVAACATPESAPLTESERVAITDAVVAGMHDYEAAIKALDVQRVLAHYQSDSQFRFIDNETVYSYDSLGSLVQQLFGSLRGYDGGFGPIHVNVLSRDAAIADAPYTDVYTDTAGAVTRIQGMVTWVWVRGPSGWRITHGQAFSGPATTAPR